MASWLEKLLNQGADQLDDEDMDEGEEVVSGFALPRNARIVLAIIVTIVSAFVIWWIMS